MDTIELFIDEEDGKPGVFAISLVEFPAIKSNFVALNEHKVDLKVIDEEKRMVVGLALIPNKEILRVREGYKYNIIFNEETVRKASQLYLREVRNHNTTVDHGSLVEGVYICESWIVENPEMDKINLYDIEAPKGAWAISMKVEDDSVWEGVKQGKYLGFSIEGIFQEGKVDMYEQKWNEVKKIILE